MQHPDFPRNMTNEVSTRRALAELYFEVTILGCGRNWGDLRLDATNDFMAWILVLGAYTTKHTHCSATEMRLPGKIAPIEIMSIIYQRWKDANPDVDADDDLLIMGRKWIEYKNILQLLIPKAPTLWAERQFFRFCLTFIEQRYDWIETDYEVEFSYTPGQLKISAKDIILFCPARGTWVGTSTVSAKLLFHRIPKRFIGELVSLRAESNKLLIDSRKIDSKWNDPE